MEGNSVLAATKPGLVRQDLSPLYLQLKNNLLEAIADGRYAPGDPLPTEQQLCAAFGVSRITVRRAVSELQDEGILEKRHGKGTFVSFRRMQTSLVDLAGFSESYSLQGFAVHSVILDVVETKAGPLLARKLSVGENAPILSVTRLISANGVPMTIDAAEFPLGRFPDLAGQIGDDTSIYRILKSCYKHEVKHAERIINVRLASSRERDILNCKLGEPLFEIEKIVSDAAQIPMQRSILLTSTNRISLTIRI
ncbi:MAG: GntR family transcriptional regulator [Azospirillaceae bacterium]|nr:GntR family transcriptional regulator [Azospirillaceae bacterium]